MGQSWRQGFSLAAVSGRQGALVVALIAIGVAAAITWGLEIQAVNRLEKNPAESQLLVIQEALDSIRDDFRRIQQEMHDEARALSGDPRIVRNLRAVRSGDRSGEEGIVRVMASYELRDHAAVEIYDQQPRIVGWSGSSLPLDSSPNAPGFLDRPLTSLAFDGDRRSALVVWWPVRDGSDTIGAVRVLRMIVKHVPVRNEYLRDYTLDEEWSRMTGLSVRLELGPTDNREVPDLQYSRLMQGTDGSVLARVFVTPPDEESLAESLRDRYTDIVYIWLVLGLLVLLGIVGKWSVGSVSLEGNVRPAFVRFGAFALSTAAVRYLLLGMNVPARWQEGKAPLSPLFDPQHLASNFGSGLMRTSGDMLLSAVFFVVLALVFVRVTEPVRKKMMLRLTGVAPDLDGAVSALDRLRFSASFGLHAAVSIGMLLILAVVSENAVLDSTLGYFERSGLLPERLVLIVFAALLLSTFASLFIVSRALWVILEFVGPDKPMRMGSGPQVMLAGLGALSALALIFFLTGMQDIVGWKVALGFLAAVYILALFSPLKSDRVAEWLHLRSVIPSIVLVSLLLYPLLEQGFETERRLRMQTAAASFVEDMDSRVLFAIGQILDRADEIDLSGTDLLSSSEAAVRFDSVARALTYGELIASLGTHDISVTITNRDGTPLGRYFETLRRRSRRLMDEADEDRYDLLRAMYEGQGDTGVLIEKMTGQRERERFVFEGFSPVTSEGHRIGWLMVRAEPQETAREGATPFPRVLVPAGYYGASFANMSLAEFQDGILIRSYGRSFGRYTLDSDVSTELTSRDLIWRSEKVGDKEYLSLYTQSTDARVRAADVDPTRGGRATVVAVRLPGINFFDHLYYLLRITIAGLILGLPIYLIGVGWRFQAGLLPSKQVQFRDKVLNAFFVVGTITVAAMGWVGLQVVTGENENAIESWLKQHLERVEDALAIDAQGEELPYRVLERSDLDSLSARVGLNLNVYRALELERSSLPRLVRERLFDSRLPILAYEALYFDGFRFISVDQTIGSFSYRAGYRALTDERGVPRYVISLPTLPEQERIEEERARTVAYLFGALLLLVLVVMVTAALLANALSRPIARLRAGLQAVAKGHFETIGPVRSRDEIGELVDTFNAMQEQLVESRRMLAHQERQLAWREMARQVAHEIKNPLTPMKLSIQHLRSAFNRSGQADAERVPPGREAFESKFNRTTTTLIEQIDALARIADEFSSFGRMPQIVKEPLNINAVVVEAATLMQNETGVVIETELYEGVLSVEGDNQALRRLLINLIKNALQAIPEGRDGMVRLATTRVEDQKTGPSVLVRVTDNGTGIPEDLWEKIFVPSFSTKTSGTGLGLALAQKTIEDLDGDIGFETEEGVGTTFWIRIPLSTD